MHDEIHFSKSFGPYEGLPNQLKHIINVIIYNLITTSICSHCKILFTKKEDFQLHLTTHTPSQLQPQHLTQTLIRQSNSQLQDTINYANNKIITCNTNDNACYLGLCSHKLILQHGNYKFSSSAIKDYYVDIEDCGWKFYASTDIPCYYCKQSFNHIDLIHHMKLAHMLKNHCDECYFMPLTLSDEKDHYALFHSLSKPIDAVTTTQTKFVECTNKDILPKFLRLQIEIPSDNKQTTFILSHKNLIFPDNITSFSN